ncbi:MAG: hypothetical protein JWN52_4485 [Actinomycetia bacterium]|nr:hypothetical protein [Actinomycetes bacterium]
MTYDVIALLRGTPDTSAILAAILDAGEDLQLDTIEGAGIIAVHDPDGQPLAAIEAPVLIQVDGEAERLLGPIAAHLRPPLWWLEIHALERSGAGTVARTIAASLTARLEGIVWHPDEVSTR